MIVFRKKGVNMGKLPHKRQTQQKWLVGQKVRLTMQYEPALKGVPKGRLTSKGRIAGVSLKFSRTPKLRRVVYVIKLDSELLGGHEWVVQPGFDTMKVEVLKQATK